MKTIYEIKVDAFKEFLNKLGTHKPYECMDTAPMNVDFDKIKIPKQK